MKSIEHVQVYIRAGLLQLKVRGQEIPVVILRLGQIIMGFERTVLCDDTVIVPVSHR